MLFSLLADITAMIHALFVVFVTAGGLLGYAWPLAVRIHFPVAIYGIAIMVFDWPCPLTRFEIMLRSRSGESVSWTEFLQHYLFTPLGMTGDEWYVLAVLVVAMVCFNYRPYRKVWGRVRH
jgi:Protein of Unknown function (DUF2784)